jgi:c-di-GMP-binding flagellar brake protein YcgR
MTTPPPHPDRRAGVRNAISVPVTYGAADAWLEGRVVDISAGGLGVTGPKLFPAGTKLELRFGAVPGKGHLLAMAAVVRHTQGARMGVEFLNFGAGDHRKVLDTVQHLLAHVPHPDQD